MEVVFWGRKSGEGTGHLADDVTVPCSASGAFCDIRACAGTHEIHLLPVTYLGFGQGSSCRLESMGSVQSIRVRFGAFHLMARHGRLGSSAAAHGRARQPAPHLHSPRPLTGPPHLRSPSGRCYACLLDHCVGSRLVTIAIVLLQWKVQLPSWRRPRRKQREATR